MEIKEPFPVSEYARFAAQLAITWPTPGGIRHYVRYREQTGFAGVLVRQGGRWLIDPIKFLEWRRCSRDLDKKPRPAIRTRRDPVER